MNKKPKLIIVTGRPGAGKTTLAKKLASIMFYPTLIRDEIKEGYVNTFGIKHDQLPKETNGTVSQFFLKSIESYIKTKVSLIAECSFSHHFFESKLPIWDDIAYTIFVLADAKPETCANRHLQRGLNNPNREFYHGDARVAHYRKNGEVLPCLDFIYPNFNIPTFKISTEEGYVPDLKSIAETIQKL